ncbi:hypothetical protein RvY_19302 [Ramazzottius varieornatus]|uniref:Uncharacterized protein n=1 Tax=Ramazzottius varieornatus TaxID=947166 RepID=A0A1D1W901_RAMVA|nr:hypothetical protein RvY_19302 [Ramazzottius varieornatus]
MTDPEKKMGRNGNCGRPFEKNQVNQMMTSWLTQMSSDGPDDLPRTQNGFSTSDTACLMTGNQPNQAD